MKKIFLILFFFLVGLGKIYSQEVSLSADDLAQFKERVGIMVDDFQDYLGFIASKESKPQEKTYYIGETLKLFINNGEKVVMETSSTRSKEIREWRLKDYLKHLSTLPYAKVEISQAETYYVSNFYPVGENKYEASVTIFQKFCGYVRKEGKLVKQYCDVTKKTIKVSVELVEDLYGKRWILKLGDVSVAQTTD